MRLVSFLAALAVLPAFAAAPMPAEVAAKETGIGSVFTTAAGLSLYTYDKDVARDESTCVAKCAEAWPPLVAPAAAAPVGEWTIATRPDGGRQWSYRGKPVYTFARDPHPGATLGDGVQDVWHIAFAPAPRPRAVLFQGTVAGRVAADAKGHTLYAADRDCTGRCLEVWTPLKAAWAANTVGDWSAVIRKDDGTKQWAYRGKPVYAYANDIAPGDMKGDGLDGAWHAIVLQPTPAAPSWVTLQRSDYGLIFADAKGMTLYAIGNDLDEVKRLYCDAACFKANWFPVLAEANAKPSGNWGLAALPEGRQWTYRGQPVFTYAGDKKPSDISGDKFAVGNGFGGFKVMPQKTLIEESF
jgi:predicted lipoprotein with Yx(FWY)xxD motif